MSKSLRVLAVIAVLSLLALPLVAQSAAYDFDATAASTASAGSAHAILTHPRALAKYLHLSADQGAQLQALWTTLQTAEEATRTARAPLCAQLRTDLGASAPNASAVGTDSINLYNNKQQIRTARQTFDAAFTAILTPEQATKYAALKQIAHLDNGPGTDILGECPPAS